MSDLDSIEAIKAHALTSLASALAHLIEAERASRALNCLAVPTEKLEGAVRKTLDAMLKINRETAETEIYRITEYHAQEN